VGRSTKEGSVGDWSTEGLPTGTVTFLLIEVDGSTGSWEHDSPTTAAEITSHFEVLDDVIARRHGRRLHQQGEELRFNPAAVLKDGDVAAIRWALPPASGLRAEL
jgi:class 3 adenylate cyclase